MTAVKAAARWLGPGSPILVISVSGMIVIVIAMEVERLLAAQEECCLGNGIELASSIEALAGLASCGTGQPRAKASLDWLGTLVVRLTKA